MKWVGDYEHFSYHTGQWVHSMACQISKQSDMVPPPAWGTNQVIHELQRNEQQCLLPDKNYSSK